MIKFPLLYTFAQSQNRRPYSLPPSDNGILPLYYSALANYTVLLWFRARKALRLPYSCVGCHIQVPWWIKFDIVNL